MPTRTELALAICEGLPDAVLAERGNKALIKTILRKREYKAAASALHKQATAMALTIQSLREQLETAKEQIAALKALDADILDVSEAANLLAGIGAAKK